MTKEDLEELEALARDLKERNANLVAAAGTAAFVPKAPQAADLILRVLEERRRLLAALHREHESDTGLSQESLADLAFAEAPAT